MASESDACESLTSAGEPEFLNSPSSSSASARTESAHHQWIYASTTITSKELIAQFMAMYEVEQRDFQRVREERDKLENDVSKLKESLEDLKFEVKEKEEIISDQKEMLTRVEDDYSQALSKLTDVENENKQLKEEVERLKSLAEHGENDGQGQHKQTQTENFQEVSQKINVLIKRAGDSEVQQLKDLINSSRCQQKRKCTANFRVKRLKNNNAQISKVECVDLTGDDEDEVEEIDTVDGARNGGLDKTWKYKLIGFCNSMNNKFNVKDVTALPLERSKSVVINLSPRQMKYPGHTYQFYKCSGGKIYVFQKVVE